MTWRRLSIILVLGAISLPGAFAATPPLTKEWTAWLDEVGPIMTKPELSVFKSLQTEEDRRRFQEMFWKARDATPGTAQNEYRMEYYLRRGYAEAHYDGARTDRGRIYLLLGKPAEVQNFSGSEKVVDCELWLFQNEGRRGLPPMLYLLFYRKDNLGDYVLFYPGLNSNLEILSTSYMRGSVRPAQAYRIISSSFPELAKATLSVIPEEANAAFAGTPNSSANVIGQIYALPEKEAYRGYLRNFTAVEGTVDVSYSAKEVAAKAAFWLTELDGIRFLNYPAGERDPAEARRGQDTGDGGAEVRLQRSGPDHRRRFRGQPDPDQQDDGGIRRPQGKDQDGPRGPASGRGL
jgi:GWxTD domain-containing protein